MKFTSKQPIFFDCPADESLQAYKDWIRAMTQALGGTVGDNVTEEEWQTGWRKFLGKEAGPARS